MPTLQVKNGLKALSGAPEEMNFGTGNKPLRLLDARHEKGKPIGWRNPQVIQHLHLVQHEQFSQSDLLHFARQFTQHLTTPDFFSFLGCKPDDHAKA